MRGEPGTRGTSRSRMVRPPMKEKPRSSTSNPSGTMIFTPPQKATAVISTSGPSISARRRSMSHPPMTATALVLPPIRQRPLVLCPLMMATCQRRGLRAGGLGIRRRLGTGQVRHDGVEVAPCLGLEGQSDPLGELVERQPALDHVLAQRRHGAVAVGVGHTLAEGATVAGGRALVLGNRKVRHGTSLPGPARSGARPDDPSGGPTGSR